jgi:hypothetical protein
MASKKSRSLKDVEIFQAGTYWFEDINGKEYSITYTDDDVKEIANNTNTLIGADMHSPPGKLGHSTSVGAPAIGWVQSTLRAKGENPAKLVADFEDIPAPVYEMFEQKLYKKISSEIYHAKATAQYFGDKVKGLTLRAVAFLGAEVPRVKGLAAFLSESAKMHPERAAFDMRAIVFGESKQKEVTMAKKDEEGPLMAPVNRHPWGALVTGTKGNDSGLKAGDQYNVQGVHQDGSYDLKHKESGSMHKSVPHEDCALMTESASSTTEAQMSEADKKALELAEKKATDAVLLAEKNGADASSAKAQLVALQKESRDRTFAEFCEKHKAAIKPAFQPKLKALFEAGVAAGAVKFGEGDKATEKPYSEQLMSFLSELIGDKGVILGSDTPGGKEGAMKTDPAEVALAEEPFQVHLDDAKRSEVKPVIVHGDLTVLAEEYMVKHVTNPDTGKPYRFAEALKHVAKLEKASITSKGGNA